MKTTVLSVHVLRRAARARERDVQEWLDAGRPLRFHMPENWKQIPDWATGARVEKAGPFQWAVVATSERGH